MRTEGFSDKNGEWDGWPIYISTDGLYIFRRTISTDGLYIFRQTISTDGLYIFRRTAYIYFDGRPIYTSTDGLYIFGQTAYIYLDGRPIYISTDGLYIFGRRPIYICADGLYIFRRTAYIYFDGRPIYISTDGLYIFVRTAYIYFEKAFILEEETVHKTCKRVLEDCRIKFCCGYSSFCKSDRLISGEFQTAYLTLPRLYKMIIKIKFYGHVLIVASFHLHFRI